MVVLVYHMSIVGPAVDDADDDDDDDEKYRKACELEDTGEDAGEGDRGGAALPAAAALELSEERAVTTKNTSFLSRRLTRK